MQFTSEHVQRTSALMYYVTLHSLPSLCFPHSQNGANLGAEVFEDQVDVEYGVAQFMS